MKRIFEKQLSEWDKEKKKPLMIIGVRQSGKTYLISKYCEKHYKNFIHINLFADDRLTHIFNENGEFKKRRELLCSVYNFSFDDKETILFVDEVQMCPKFIQDLKLFCENGINNIIVAGSLLGVTLKGMDESFPVGKVNLKNFYPMNFEEFLIATGNDRYIKMIKDSFENLSPFPLHEELMSLFRRYLFVGGMPEALKDYIDNNQDTSKMNKDIIKDIVESYKQDITKHVENIKDKIRVQNIYDNVIPQLMKENPKFMYAKFDNKDRKSDYISALDFLVSSHMILKCNQLNKIEYPIKAYQDDNNYKLFLSDIGILREMAGIEIVDVLMAGNYAYKGVLTENYVAEELLRMFGYLSYWTRKNDDNGNKAEVDFVIQIGTELIPIEVKSGRNQAQSLKIYNELFHPKYMLKIGDYNFGISDNLITIPLYATFLIKDVLEKRK